MKGSGVLSKSSDGLNKSASGQASRHGNTGKLINEHYLEIEYVLNRVEGSTTHYQLLGLERSATNEQIVVAYHETVAVLHPSYYKVRASLPDDMLAKVDSAFGRVSQAFLVLTDCNKRSEYDRSLKRRKVIPLPLDAPKPKLRYPVAVAVQRVLVALKPFVPQRLFEYLIMDNYKLT